MCPKCGKTHLHRFTAQTIKSTGKGIETLNEETYWKCLTTDCGYKEQEKTLGGKLAVSVGILEKD